MMEPKWRAVGTARSSITFSRAVKQINHCYFGPVRFGFIMVWKQQGRVTNETDFFLGEFFRLHNVFYSVITRAFGGLGHRNSVSY